MITTFKDIKVWQKAHQLVLEIPKITSQLTNLLTSPMYFVHPQIKFNFVNLLNLFFCFLKKKDKNVFRKIEGMFPNKKIFFTDMGRTAFRLIIETLGLQNSEMLVPAYTCDIFGSLFEDYNLTPVFLDCDKQTFNLNCQNIENKITPNTKSILVSHTYGLPADLAIILNLAQKHNLKVIEDCAHSFGSTYKGTVVGNFGEAAFFSFYKLFPTLRGGMVILPSNIQERKLTPTHFSFRDFISLLNCFSFFSFLFKKYGGEIAQKNIRQEKVAKVARINRVSFNIFAWQMKNFERILAQRKKMGLLFQTELKKLGFETQSATNNSFTFLSALTPENIDRNRLVMALRKKGVFATRIWHTPLILNLKVQKKFGIDLSQFPNTVEVAQRITNFPLQNFFTEKDIQEILKKIRSLLKVNF